VTPVLYKLMPPDIRADAPAVDAVGSVASSMGVRAT